MGWEIVLNADEEVSSLGSAPLLAEVAERCQFGLTFEPAATPEGTLAGGRKGSGNFAAAYRMAAPPMPAAIRRTGVTPSSPPPISPCVSTR